MISADKFDRCKFAMLECHMYFRLFCFQAVMLCPLDADLFVTTAGADAFGCPTNDAFDCLSSDAIYLAVMPFIFQAYVFKIM
jgi:hypothetical protein